jgi:glycosyltransferase involved in cell wall biosynthesis
VGEARGAFRERLGSAGVEILDWAPGSAWDVAGARRLALALSRADLIHLHSPRAFFLGRLAALSCPRPSVLTVHVEPDAPGGLRSRLYGGIERLLGRRFPDRVIYVSARALRETRAPWTARARVVENAAPPPSPATRAEARAALGCREDQAIVVSVARLARQKDLGTLVEAAELVGRGEFWIVGEGPERAALEGRVAALGLPGRVRFLGARSDVPRLLRAADVFVLSSLYEGMSVALLEAMAAGLPAVATDVGESGRLLGETGAGLLVPPRDKAALAAAIRTLLEAPERARGMGRKGEARAALLTERATFEETAAVYEEALALAGRPRS